jgi:uncharacterized membrane protein YqjE
MAEPLRKRGPHERPLGELLADLSEQSSRLVRQEIRLAKAELSAKLSEVARAAILFGVAAVAGFFVLWALSWTAVEALAGVLPRWGAALVVAGVWAAIAGVMALVGVNRSRRAMPPVPEETVETLKEDVQWAKERKRSAGR